MTGVRYDRRPSFLASEKASVAIKQAGMEPQRTTSMMRRPFGAGYLEVVTFFDPTSAIKSARARGVVALYDRTIDSANVCF